MPSGLTAAAAAAAATAIAAAAATAATAATTAAAAAVPTLCPCPEVAVVGSRHAGALRRHIVPVPGHFNDNGIIERTTSAQDTYWATRAIFVHGIKGPAQYASV